MATIVLFIVPGLLLLAWFVRTSYAPWLLLGILYNKETAQTVRGDAELDGANMREHGETWRLRFAWTHNIKTPIYQAFVKQGGAPWVVLNDPREIEDLNMRRNKEFDRVREGTNTLSVIAPHATIAHRTQLQSSSSNAGSGRAPCTQTSFKNSRAQRQRSCHATSRALEGKAVQSRHESDACSP